MIYKVGKQNLVDFTEQTGRRNISTGSSLEQEDAQSYLALSSFGRHQPYSPFNHQQNCDDSGACSAKKHESKILGEGLPICAILQNYVITTEIGIFLQTVAKLTIYDHLAIRLYADQHC